MGPTLSGGFYYDLLAKGMIKPEDEEPETHGIEFYIAAFRELGTCRDTSTTSPIPFTSILEYWKVYRSGDFDEFLYFMRLMDDTLLKLESNKASKP